MTDALLPPQSDASGAPSTHFASGHLSLVAGLAGLGALTLFFGVLFPIEIALLNWYDVVQPTYVPMMIMVQSMLFPPVISFSFAAVAAMFWYGGLLLRFAMAIAIVLPGCVGFYATVTYTDGPQDTEFLQAFSMVMFTCLLSTATVALAAQMWSRWTLTHARKDVSPFPMLGIRSLIELTAIAALGFTAFVSSDSADFVEGILLFGCVSSLMAAATISAMIAYFRAGKNRLVAAIIGFVFAFGAACTMNCFFAVQEFGWSILSGETILIGMTSVYGAAVICGVMWLCLRWLRFWGWRCLNRRQMRNMAIGDA